jgi:streptothricin acetyltransferase
VPSGAIGWILQGSPIGRGGHFTRKACRMVINITEEPMAALEDYGRIPIAFEVARVLDVVVRHDGLDGYVLSERCLEVPYIKDYDAIEGEGPNTWATRFDLSTWRLMTAHVEGQRVGGAVIAFNTPDVTMLEGRRDLSALWDIRVSSATRGQGVGSALFRAVETWCTARGCRRLKIETQNINVAACRFYERQGCVLEAVNHFVYRELPDEIQLLWYKDLSQVAASNDAPGSGRGTPRR